MTIFDTIYRITNIKVDGFLQSFVNFYEQKHDLILSYYTDYNAEYPKEAFDVYKQLKKQVEYIISKMAFYKNYFSSTAYWDIFTQLDDIQYKLNEIEEYPRFYNVSFYKKQNQQEVYDTYIMKQHETLQQVAEKFNQDENDIAIINLLKEEDYTRKGGTSIILKSNIITQDPELQEIESICDIALGENLLGKDFPYSLEIEESEYVLGEGDIKVDNPQQTFLRTLDRLFNLAQGAIPEYPTIGVDKSIIQMALSDTDIVFPIIIRQLMEVINTDDTIYSCSIEDVDKVEGVTDTFKFKISVQNRLLEEIPLTFDIN